MPNNEFGYIAAWLVALWAFGWAMLPLSHRIFKVFPDGGLAIGRLLGVVLVSLAAFWGASLHILPLKFSPALFLVAVLGGALGWRHAELRVWVKEQRRSLVVSDAVFLAAFLFFLWVRLRHPSAADLEKPMDMALLAAARRAEWLPFENPWYSGHSFTNYYYFGPLMAALLSRVLLTPPWFAYNLAIAVFSACFLSLLWSVGAGVTGSKKWAVIVLLLVGLGGHLEPLRQIYETRKYWPLDWWKTSRVITNTINEYPAFTLSIGDAHAHFYALALSALFFALCFNLIRAHSVRVYQATLALCGVLLGVFLLTNTWDVPLYALLLMVCVGLTPVATQQKLLVIPAVLLAPLCALPYFLRFKSQVSGVVFEAWMPEPLSFLLLWGGWIVLALLALGFTMLRRRVWGNPSLEARFCIALALVGAWALAAPYLFYIKGYFGDSELRHQDTVFKFGLQAWLLLGTGISCALGRTFLPWLKTARPVTQWAATSTALALLAVLALAPVTVIWTRTTRDAPRELDGSIALSLNAMKFLPPNEQEAIRWLEAHVQPGQTLLEPSGNDYDPQAGRFATFTGIPTYLGWPQHVWFWGAEYGDVEMRKMKLLPLFTVPNAFQAQGVLQEIRPSYLVLPENLSGPDGELPEQLQQTTRDLSVAWPPDGSGYPKIVQASKR